MAPRILGLRDTFMLKTLYAGVFLLAGLTVPAMACSEQQAIDDLTIILYNEAVPTAEYQAAVAAVAYNRWQDGWNPTLCDVVRAKGQFAFHFPDDPDDVDWTKFNIAKANAEVFVQGFERGEHLLEPQVFAELEGYFFFASGKGATGINFGGNKFRRHY